ncbi:hypothetical protein [Sphingomonas fuzhouensis]|uniref:hypothetical protein n=1 Tax=Sphingomonas fuzhouensis TaxID=3106033 RepID=UPI002AFFEE0A|nr:hypothetical protein [Sphingomonas sp. SGZ-02]
MSRILMAAIALALPGAVQAASKPVVESWGKSGIGFAQYRADAIECAKTGYFRDVSQDEPAKRFIRGFETADRLLNFPNGSEGDDWGDSVRRTQPDRQKRDLQAIQVGDVEQCLTDKGYSRFTLTPAEVKTLSRYPRGSEARHQYLHSLAAR